MSRELYITRRIEMIEENLEHIKRFVSIDEGKLASLRGVWEGVDFQDEDIEEARRSLFKGVELDSTPNSRPLS